jgi:predicted  nucleic acid-binding Zn-ribbon protein
MTNDISTAKKFRDEYFTRLGHEMNSYTVISLMVEYAAAQSIDPGQKIDTEVLQRQVETLREEKDLMQTQITSLEITTSRLERELETKEGVISDLTEQVLALQGEVQEEAVMSPQEVEKPKAPKKNNGK